MGKENGIGKYVAGAIVGAGIGLLLAPKAGSETRKDLKKKFDEFLEQIKNINADDVKKEFNQKVKEIKKELSDLDKQKVIDIAKDMADDVKNKAQELVELAKEKGTPVLKKSAEDILENVIKVSRETLKKLEDK